MRIGYKIHRCSHNNLGSRCCPTPTRMPGCRHRCPRTPLAQIGTARNGSPMNVQMRSARGGIQSKRCKRTKPRVESKMVAAWAGSAKRRRCSGAATSGQRRPVTSTTLMTMHFRMAVRTRSGSSMMAAGTETTSMKVT
jgi:hypothetical protein